MGGGFARDSIEVIDSSSEAELVGSGEEDDLLSIDSAYDDHQELASDLEQITEIVWQVPAARAVPLAACPEPVVVGPTVPCTIPEAIAAHSDNDDLLRLFARCKRGA